VAITGVADREDGLVIDEAWGMSEAEYHLVRTLIEHNGGLRLIAPGGGGKNIYEFRGSSSARLESLLGKGRGLPPQPTPARNADRCGLCMIAILSLNEKTRYK